MSMSTHIIGFRPTDERWKKMKAIWDSCEEMNINIPDEVSEFFQGEKPDPTGIEVSLPNRKWNDEYREGFEIDVKAIPKNVTIIRFYNSW